MSKMWESRKISGGIVFVLVHYTVCVTIRKHFIVKQPRTTLFNSHDWKVPSSAAATDTSLIWTCISILHPFSLPRPELLLSAAELTCRQTNFQSLRSFPPDSFCSVALLRYQLHTRLEIEGPGPGIRQVHARFQAATKKTATFSKINTALGRK